MSDFDLIDAYRLVNAACAAGTLAVAAYTIPRRWRAWNSRTRIGVEAILAWAVVVMIGTAENIAQDNPGGVRTFLSTVAVIWGLLALWPRKGRRRVDSST